MLDKISDILLFREGTEEEADGSRQPILTTGSIVWGIILRTALIMVVCFFFFGYLEFRQYWWLGFFFIWLGAAYPGWRQFQKFQKRIKKVEESTLCGSCRHFDSSGQLCKIYDEHITRDYIPCEGLSWEPRHIDSED